MRLENTTPFASNFTLALDKQGHEQIVLVVRATFTLSPRRGEPSRVAPEQRHEHGIVARLQRKVDLFG